MNDNEAVFFGFFIIGLVIFGVYAGYTQGQTDLIYKQKLGTVIIENWGDEGADMFLLINPITHGFYSDHETLEEAVLSALELYEHGQINRIIFDLNRDGIPDETLFEKAVAQ